MKNYIKPEIEQIPLSTGDIMNTSGDPTDQVKSVYGSWATILKGGVSSTSFGDYDDNGGFN